MHRTRFPRWQLAVIMAFIASPYALFVATRSPIDPRLHWEGKVYAYDQMEHILRASDQMGCDTEPKPDGTVVVRCDTLKNYELSVGYCVRTSRCRVDPVQEIAH